MADIAKCAGASCKQKENCYRYTAPMSEIWQSYINPEHTETECDRFWDNKEYLKMLRKTRNG